MTAATRRTAVGKGINRLGFVETLEYRHVVLSRLNLPYAWFVALVNGETPRKTLLQQFFPVAGSIYAGLLALAIILYPPPYSIVTNTISDLGNPVLNPAGWGFFTASCYVIAFTLLPFYTHVYKQFWRQHFLVATIAWFSNLSASAGLVMLGTFPNLPGTLYLHVTAAIASFGGLIGGGLLDWTLLVGRALRTGGKARHQAIVAIGVMVATGCIALFLLGMIDVNPATGTATVDEFVLFAFMEWLLFALVGYQTVLLFVRLPPKLPPREAFARVGRVNRLNPGCPPYQPTCPADAK